MLKVGITRLHIAFEDRETTKERCLKIIEDAAGEGVEFLVFPEMTLVGFTMEPELVSESYGGGKIPDSISFFMRQSKKYGMDIAFGYIEKTSGEDGAPVYSNKLAVVSGGELILEYSKIHPFSYSGEDKVYTAGDKLADCKVKDMRIQGYICYDLRFPEIFSAVREKLNTLLVIANWPEARVAQWEALLKARAIENQAYMIGVNCCGESGGLNYAPSSHVYNHLGEDIAVVVNEELSVAEIDGSVIAKAREEFPQSKDRKNQLYVELYR